MTSKVYNKQIGGSHYKNMVMQPSEFINKNKLLFAEGNAIKYICRHARNAGISKEEAEKKPETWVEGYNKWKELSMKGVISNKVKLGDLKKLLK